MDLTKFRDIAPFNDEEAAAALSQVAGHPMVPMVSSVLFPDKEAGFLREVLLGIRTVEQFQQRVMRPAVQWVIDHTVTEFTYSGTERLVSLNGKYLAMSNHRDIVLDPAFTQLILFLSGAQGTQICVGDNLLKVKEVELLIRSNRMIKVIRGISPRELYLSSQLLSQYIRETIVSGSSSVWIAQRQGRTKDGLDTTEQGLLKMLDMSGGKDFVQNYKALNIVPLSISYELEPCDLLKARERLISRSQTYVKGEMEDLQSILTGIRQPKGRVHLNIDEPITEEELAAAAACDKNDRYQYLRQIIDRRIVRGYKLWSTHYAAYDRVNRTTKYSDYYTPEQKEFFEDYIAKQVESADAALNKTDLQDILLHIYSNPVLAKEQLV